MERLTKLLQVTWVENGRAGPLETSAMPSFHYIAWESAKETFRVMDIFLISTVTVSQAYTLAKTDQTIHLNMCSVII